MALLRPMRMISPLLLLAALASGSRVRGPSSPYNPDVDLDTPQTIRRYGYPAEAHTVRTGDGYLLTLHRIPPRPRSHSPDAHAPQHTASLPPVPPSPPPSPPTSPPTPPSPPTATRVVLLQHGLLSSSYDWIVAGPGKGLAYLLADAGYDVWLGNARGNTYSRAHTKLPTDSSSPFWNFSFHEMGVDDLPAVIDYILQRTGEMQLNYVGHSMGTTMFFVMASTRPEYAAKVHSAHALAPVAFVGHIKSPVRLLVPLAHDIELLTRLLGAGELLPQSKLLKYLAKYGCELYEPEKVVCENVIFVLCGYDAPEFDQRLLPLILSHTPAGASTKTIIHYAQMVKSGKFQWYDYGKKGNVKAYNWTVPPEYNLSKINITTHLYYADNDWLASIVDVNALYSNLKCTKSKYLVPMPKFNHLDFLVARDAKTLVYDKILKMLPLYGGD